MSIFPQRILFIVNTMNVGGAETFVMKLFRKIDREKVIFDFLINELNEDYYITEIKSLGGRIYVGCSKSKNLMESLRIVFKVVRDNDYKTVFRLAEHPLSFLDLLSAKMGGAKKRIARSTNTKSSGRFSGAAAIVARPWMDMVANVKLAPSTEAAEWIFGKKAVHSKEVIILKNAVDLDTYKYTLEGRVAIRKEFHIENKFVVGHIGRFNQQKNHIFLIRIFSEIVKQNENAVLFLVGKGELEKEIQIQINELGIQDHVIFLGVRSDVPDILSAMDVFIFPSLYEGMPNVVIEAQATGLPCVISDSITNEVKLSDLVKSCSLDDDIKIWSDIALGFEQRERAAYKEVIQKSGYSIDDTVRDLEQIFTK